MPTKNLLHFMAAPSRVASKLDWKKTGSVLSVDIGRDRIGMAVAPHPSSQQPIRTLPPLVLKRETRHGNRRTLTQACVSTMASIVQDHQVCALLVSWPVQHEGRCGKPCGQVLHTLDALLEESNTIVTKQRPVCLWDDRHIRPHHSDEWGRDPLFGKCSLTDPTKTVHVASKEQYQHHDCSSAVAAQVWQDFCQAHWPEINNGSGGAAAADKTATTAAEKTATTDAPAFAGNGDGVNISTGRNSMMVVEYEAYERQKRIEAGADDDFQWNVA